MLLCMPFGKKETYDRKPKQSFFLIRRFLVAHTPQSVQSFQPRRLWLVVMVVLFAGKHPPDKKKE
jgi:hypothetical protein